MRKMTGIFIEMKADTIISAFGTTANGELIPLSAHYLKMSNYTSLGATLQMVSKAYDNGFYVPYYRASNAILFNVWVHQLNNDEPEDWVSDRWRKCAIEADWVEPKFLKRGEIK